MTPSLLGWRSAVAALLWRLLPAALFGFAAGPACREDRFPFRLFGGLPARLLQLLCGTSLLFCGLPARPIQFLRSADLLFDPQGFRLAGGSLGCHTLLARLFLGFSRCNSEIASPDKRLALIAAPGRLGTCCGG